MFTPKKGLGLEADLSGREMLHFSERSDSFFDIPSQNVIRTFGAERFLAHVTQGKGDETVRFELRVNGKERAARSRPGSRTAKDIPDREIDDFEASLKRLLESSNKSADATRIIDNFRLPDPDLEPEMYRTYGWPWQRRLLVAWGCEKQAGSSLPPLEAVAKLRTRASKGYGALAALPGILVLLLLLLALIAAWYQWPSAKLALSPSGAAEVGQPVIADFRDARGRVFDLAWADDARLAGVPSDGTRQDAHQYYAPGEKQVTLTARANLWGLIPVSSTAMESLTVNPRREGISRSNVLRADLYPEHGSVPNTVTAFVQLPEGTRASGLMTLAGHKIGTESDEPVQFPPIQYPGDYLLRWTPDAGSGLASESLTIQLRDPAANPDAPVFGAFVEVTPNGEAWLDTSPSVAGASSLVRKEVSLSGGQYIDVTETHRIKLPAGEKSDIKLRYTDASGNITEAAREETPRLPPKPKESQKFVKRPGGKGGPAETMQASQGGSPDPRETSQTSLPAERPGPEPVPDMATSALPDTPRPPVETPGPDDELVIRRFVEAEARDGKQAFILKAGFDPSGIQPAVRSWKLDGQAKKPTRGNDLELALPSGKYLVQVEAEDAAGKSYASEPYELIVDITVKSSVQLNRQR